MAPLVDIEMDEVQQPTLHPGAENTNKLRGSRSLPDLLHADSNLQSSSSAHGPLQSTTSHAVPVSTAVVSPDGISQPAPVVTTNELHGSPSSLELPLFDNSLRTSPSAPDWECYPIATSASVPDYDYLDKVKSLCDEIEPNLYDNLFEKHFQEGHGKVLLISKEVTECILPSSDVSYGSKWENLTIDRFLKTGSLYSSIPGPAFSTLRNLVTSATQENPHLLIIEAIDRTGIQILGTTFNLDPCFVAKHLGPGYFESWPGHSHREKMERMDSLKHKYRGFVKHRIGVPSTTEGDAKVSPQVPPWYTMYGRLHNPAYTDQAEIWEWAGAGTERVCLDEGTSTLVPRVSCIQVSLYGWIMLVDSTHSINKARQFPFSRWDMLEICSHRLPVNLNRGGFHLALRLFNGLGECADALAVRRVLFDSPDECTPRQMAEITAMAMVVSTWQINVEYLEDRFNRSRHEAIADPSLRTFHPLTLLRRNIADLDDALVEARKRIEPEFLGWTKTTQQKNLGQRVLETFGPRYDPLFHKVHVMSTKLNNEIQLVIGSVTVQDSDIMKTQARRATLLTILAVIYLPLTLVTGVFGMNLKEINDGAPRFWACIAGLAIIGGATAVGILGYRLWRHRRDARLLREQREDKVYKLA